MVAVSCLATVRQIRAAYDTGAGTSDPKTNKQTSLSNGNIFVAKDQLNLTQYNTSKWSWHISEQPSYFISFGIQCFSIFALKGSN